ncbi:MAG: hypothetical protein U1A23_02285 [Candidatus Sungbacteria bacterium]|nr:hypothetical protein [bacterium]MDZ4285733.1 hypothetical protein [Candidatus Sungbacteria bacterium]
MIRPVVVHPFVDLDACTCIAFAGADMKDVHFLPANALAVPAVCPCCGGAFLGDERVLDHPMGEKGRLDAKGNRHAAALSMPEAVNADPNLLAEVDEQDCNGRVKKLQFSLAQILRAVRFEAGHRGIRGVDLDREVVSVMSRILCGINLRHEASLHARKFVEAKARIEEVGSFKIALFPQGLVPPETGTVLNEEFDVSGTIYQDGLTLGITLYPGRKKPDLRKLAPFLPGWFIHTAGFLACWGSKKAPVTTSPPRGTPQTKDQALELLRKVFVKPTKTLPKVRVDKKAKRVPLV